MNNNIPVRWMAALCLLLAACSSTDSNRMSATDSSNTQDGSTSSYGNSSSSTAATGTMAGSTTTIAQTAYGVVQAIEQVTRQDVGLGAVGAAAAGGSMGSPMDKVYRVKVKLDDGSEQIVVVDTMPTYQVGDRIRYSNGNLQRY